LIGGYFVVWAEAKAVKDRRPLKRSFYRRDAGRVKATPAQTV